MYSLPKYHYGLKTVYVKYTKYVLFVQIFFQWTIFKLGKKNTFKTVTFKDKQEHLFLAHTLRFTAESAGSADGLERKF